MKNKYTAFALLLLSLLLFSCNADLQPIDFGKDRCDFCNMVIIDERYAASIYTSKSKTYKFDDIQCMMNFSNKLVSEITEYYVSIYDHPYEPMVRCEEAFFLQNEIFPSPMNSGYVAFLDETKTQGIADSIDSHILRWKDVMEMEWKGKK